ncbi:Putrescine-binding periplasmic protein precursor [Shimia sp. SK013]|uniref:extracellular solute-binding protein n=1 Tax=Shimia sp. SK013 TaxID=1389006 RepID=UPI0006B4A35E|nr:extracellular solute-binding protein [Shimia sp. SK013]KPA23686.1 Putrescine-binding periplasmic protein precursor [Shimia sp. SK013]
MRLNVMAITLCAAAACAQQSVADPTEVWFLNWSDYIDPTVTESFEADLGFNIEIEEYDEANAAESRLSARSTGYDLAVVSAESVARLAETGALKRIDTSLAPNIAALDGGLWDTFRSSMPQASGYSVPYLWGTTGMAFDREAVAERLPGVATDSWSLIFDPANAAKLADCGIVIADSSEEVVAITLAYLGRDPHSRAPEDIDAAFEVLEGIAPYVRSFESTLYDAFSDEDMCMALSWSTEVLGPIMEGFTDRYEFVLPKEGANLWVDVFVLPVDAENEAGAMQFLNHVISPMNLTMSAVYSSGAISAPVTLELVDWEAYDLPALTLPPEVRENLFFVSDRSVEQKRSLERRWRLMQVGM